MQEADQIKEDEVLRRMLNTPHEKHKPLRAQKLVKHKPVEAKKR